MQVEMGRNGGWGGGGGGGRASGRAEGLEEDGQTPRAAMHPVYASAAPTLALRRPSHSAAPASPLARPRLLFAVAPTGLSAYVSSRPSTKSSPHPSTPPLSPSRTLRRHRPCRTPRAIIALPGAHPAGTRPRVFSRMGGYVRASHTTRRHAAECTTPPHARGRGSCWSRRMEDGWAEGEVPGCDANVHRWTGSRGAGSVSRPVLERVR
ncbi:hypothetical protein B0H10DRAFT_158536 [Mycena sp. CBHHK59/15]|nr:hypothetical protein B0H10DRAFT_158536 [Mycena sp. CBHHK59/15]